MNTTRRTFIKSTFGMASASLIMPSLLWDSSQLLAQQSAGDMSSGEPGMIAAQSDRWAVVPFTPSNSADVQNLNRYAPAPSGQIKDFVQLYNGKSAVPQTLILMNYDETHFRIKVILDVSPSGADIFEQIDIILSTDSRASSFYQIPVPLTAKPSRPLDYDLQWDKAYPNLRRVALKEDAYSITVKGDAMQRIAEIVIPFESLNVERISLGDEWRFNVIRYRDDVAPLSMWAPVRYAMFSSGGENSYKPMLAASQEGRMGSLFFGHIPVRKLGAKFTPWSNPIWPVRWTPTDFALRYKTFTEKKIQIPLPRELAKDAIVTFKWRPPSGEMVSIDTSNIQINEKVLLGDFHHPRPTQKGNYQLFVTVQDIKESNIAIFSFDDHALIEAGESLYQFALPDYPVTQITAAPASTEVQQWLSAIPDKIGFRFTGVPGSADPTVDGRYQWDINQPHQLKTIDSGQVFPNEEYPENHTITVKNRLGEDVVYPYYEDEKGERYFLSAHRWWMQKEKALAFTRRMRKKDILSAARLLYRWAQVYPGYVSVYDWPRNNFPVDARQAPPHPRNGGIFSRWHYGDLLAMKGLVDIFDEARRTNAFEILSKEYGENVEQKIVEDMFLPEIEFVNSYNITNSNVDYRNWIGYAALGRTLNQPRHVHHAVDLLQTFHAEFYLSDGFWKEASISYHNQSTTGIEQAMASLKGWSDPPTYISPRTGDRYDDLNPQRKFPAVGKSMTVARDLVYPNGHYLPTGDTWASATTDKPNLTDKHLLVPAVGIAKLARGDGQQQSQVYLSFTPKYGHTHSDPLNINLFAKGQELLPDIGYTYVKYRRLYTSTFAHNTVVVDSANMAVGGKDGGNITAFASSSENVQVMQAEEHQGVAGTSEYRREVWFIGFDGADKSDGYIVDLFRVKGGKLHEYTLNGDANHNGAIDTDLSLQHYNDFYYPPGTKVMMPVNEYDAGNADGKYFGYKVMRDVKKADLPKSTFTVRFKSYDDKEQPLANLQVTGFVHGNGKNELYTGGMPSIRMSRLGGRAQDKNSQLDKYPDTPKMVIKSAGENLHNIFATVMEPFREKAPQLTSIESLRPDHLPEGAAVIKSTFGNTTDYILSAPHDLKPPLIIDQIELHGKMGFIRLVDGKLQQMHLIGGTLLQWKTQQLRGSGTVTGSISATLRVANGDTQNGFQTETSIAKSFEGKYFIVTHPDGKTHGYQISAISREANITTVAIGENDPGFEINGDGTSQLKFFPQTQWQGKHTFYIDNCESQKYFY